MKLLTRGEYPREPWRDCPNCNQPYQRQDSLDMAKAYHRLLVENIPVDGRDLYKMGGLEMIVDAIQKKPRAEKRGETSSQ